MIRSARYIATLALRGFHKFISPFLPCACRFYPSCSVYMAQAVEKHGLFRGAMTGFLRLSRCHPWTAGGYDPVR